MAKLGVTHAHFFCAGCQLRWEGQHTAQREAQEHTRRTGHTTHGETATAWKYSRTSRLTHPEQPERTNG